MLRDFRRRSILAGIGGLTLTGATKTNGLAELERSAGGRLGFALLDSGTGRLTGHRVDEMFGHCSTFKLLLAGLVMRAAESGQLSLDGRIAIAATDMVPVSPVTKPHIGGSLSIGELTEGTLKTSDNAAANLLMRKLGGPAGVTRRLRELGDKVTRIDRWEPELNLVIAPDQRDSSTPRAMANSAAMFLTGDALNRQHRALLAQWTFDTRTGLKRLRAGAPEGWRVGDKTGTAQAKGMPNRTNDVALLLPPGRAPLIAVGFYEAPGSFPNTRPQDEALLADAMRVGLQALKR